MCDGARWHKYRPCTSWNDAGSIIEKCWDELMELVDFGGDGLRRMEDIEGTKWQYIMEKYKCTKLTAACICFIEVNE